MLNALVLIAVIAAIAAPFWREARRVTIGSAERRDRGYDYVKLSQGVTAYRWHGPVRGKVMVLIHGVTTPSIIWSGLAPALGALGYRVLTYDLHGRGLSDAPAGRQTPAFFRRQLEDLLVALDLNEDLTLVGYSMGGAIAVDFADHHRHRLARLILIAPAGAGVSISPFMRRCMDLPLAGDWIWMALGRARLERDTAQAVDAGAMPPEVAAEVGAMLQRRGYLPAILSSYRNLLDMQQAASHRALGRDGVPVLAIWGREDRVVPISGLGRIAQWNRDARQVEIAGAGHSLPLTHAAEIADRIRQVLREPR